MNKKIILIPLIVFLIITFGIGVYFWYQSSDRVNQQADETAVKSVVTNFGQALKNVSLLSPTAPQDIETNYKDYLDPKLIAQWKTDPSKAIGRLTSSPWPESIEIGSISRFGSGAYDVSGKIIDMTSSGMSGSRAVQIGVVKFGSRWLITGISVIPSEENELWKEYSGEGVSFKYPEKLTTQYISAQEWPPTVKVESGNFSCIETPQEISSLSDITTQRLVDNRIYCLNVKNEGAAGSVYSSYVYTTPKNGKIVKVSFVLRYIGCGNYDKEQNQACTSEREAFDLDATVDRIVQTIKWDWSKYDSLAGQIARCMVMSDTASKEECDELISQITDFNSCVMAGFPIMKSNPPQCQTPDGRNFTQID
ncbi:MAG: hypothetical protein WC519_01745 [Parcubacteria group bacterium]